MPHNPVYVIRAGVVRYRCLSSRLRNSPRAQVKRDTPPRKLAAFKYAKESKIMESTPSFTTFSLLFTALPIPDTQPSVSTCSLIWGVSPCSYVLRTHGKSFRQAEITIEWNRKNCHGNKGNDFPTSGVDFLPIFLIWRSIKLKMIFAASNLLLAEWLS